MPRPRAWSHDERLLLTCSDLLTGAEDLARMRKEGTPEVLLRAGVEPPEVVLARLWATIRHSDLPGGFGPLWGACVALWRKGRAATLEQGAGMVLLEDKDAASTALRYCRNHGMGVPYMAPVAAERIIRHRESQRTQREATEIAAKAAAESARVFDGVV